MVQNRNNSWNLDYEVLLLLLKSERHLRGVARQLNQSHSTILRRLKRLQQENVLDFKTEGKNKVFFIKKNLQAKNHVLNAERYKLIKLLKRYPELGVIVEDVLINCRVGLIVLFGSYAKFMAKKDSDIDIYIETMNRKAKEEVEGVHSKIKVKLGKFDLESVMIKELVKDHVILKGAEEFYEKTKFFT